jgi:hypothetical protein
MLLEGKLRGTYFPPTSTSLNKMTRERISFNEHRLEMPENLNNKRPWMKNPAMYTVVGYFQREKIQVD